MLRLTAWDKDEEFDPKTLEWAEAVANGIPSLEELNEMLGKPYRKFFGPNSINVEQQRQKRYRRLVDEMKRLLKVIPPILHPQLHEETRRALAGQGGWE
jgi:hypothetical protein